MQKLTKECKIITRKKEVNDSLDLKVTSAPVIFNGVNYTIFSVVDMSDSERRQMLEKIFFHDVMNIAGCLKGVTDILIDRYNRTDDSGMYINMISRMSKDLMEEILSQGALAFAENGELQPHYSAIGF